MKFAVSETPGQVFVEPDLLPICGVIESKAWMYDGKTLTIHLIQKPKEYPTLRRPRPDREKIQWPAVEELLAEIKLIGIVALGKKLGVSDTAIRIRLKNAKKRTT